MFRTNSKVFGVGEFKYANKNFKGAKGVAISTNFRLKTKKACDMITIFTYMIRFGIVEFKYAI